MKWVLSLELGHGPRVGIVGNLDRDGRSCDPRVEGLAASIEFLETVVDDALRTRLRAIAQASQAPNVPYLGGLKPYGIQGRYTRSERGDSFEKGRVLELRLFESST